MEDNLADYPRSGTHSATRLTLEERQQVIKELIARRRAQYQGQEGRVQLTDEERQCRLEMLLQSRKQARVSEGPVNNVGVLREDVVHGHCDVAPYDQSDDSRSATDDSVTISVRLEGPIDISCLWAEGESASVSQSLSTVSSDCGDVAHHGEGVRGTSDLPKQHSPVNRHSRAAVSQKIAKDMEKKLTFKPQINQKDLGVGEAYHDSSQRLLKLAQPKTAQLQNLLKLKEENERVALVECTFQPKILRGPRNQEHNQHLPASERLYRLKDAHPANRSHSAAAARELAELSECTFQPATNRGWFEPEQYEPMHERVGEVLRSRHEKLAQLKMEVEAEEQCVFRPQLNPRSLRIAERGRTRSASPALRRRSSCSDVPSGAPHDATPQRTLVNPHSQRILDSAGTPQDFLERQALFEQRRRERAAHLSAALTQRHASEEGLRLSAARSSQLLAASGRCERLCESFLERVERLAGGEAQRRAAKQAALRHAHLAQFSFAPAINPRSRAIGRSHNVEELSAPRRPASGEDDGNASQADQQLRAPQRRMSQQEVEELVERLTSGQQCVRQRTLEQCGREEYEQLKECTFSPHITNKVPHRKVDAAIRGLCRHLELKAMAARQAQERQRVEDRVFLHHPRGNPQHVTVPQPFELGRRQKPTRGEQARGRSSAEQAQGHGHGDHAFGDSSGEHAAGDGNRGQEVVCGATGRTNVCGNGGCAARYGDGEQLLIHRKGEVAHACTHEEQLPRYGNGDRTG